VTQTNYSIGLEILSLRYAMHAFATKTTLRIVSAPALQRRRQHYQWNVIRLEIRTYIAVFRSESQRVQAQHLEFIAEYKNRYRNVFRLLAVKNAKRYSCWRMPCLGAVPGDESWHAIGSTGCRGWRGRGCPGFSQGSDGEGRLHLAVNIAHEHDACLSAVFLCNG
jgi:hypothetical protein